LDKIEQNFRKVKPGIPIKVEVVTALPISIQNSQLVNNYDNKLSSDNNLIVNNNPIVNNTTIGNNCNNNITNESSTNERTEKTMIEEFVDDENMIKTEQKANIKFEPVTLEDNSNEYSTDDSDDDSYQQLLNLDSNDRKKREK